MLIAGHFWMVIDSHENAPDFLQRNGRSAHPDADALKESAACDRHRSLCLWQSLARSLCLWQSTGANWQPPMQRERFLSPARTTL